MFLSDLNVFNQFIKEFIKMSIKKQNEISLETLKHHFLFITQAQKSSDRLYQFYHCRYFYYRIKKLSIIPSFLSLKNEEYKDLVKLVKSYDKELVYKVRTNKYGDRHQQYSRNTTFYAKEADYEEDIMNKTENYAKNRQNYENIVTFFQDQDLEKSFKNLEETYIFNKKTYKFRQKVEE